MFPVFLQMGSSLKQKHWGFAVGVQCQQHPLAEAGAFATCLQAPAVREVLPAPLLLGARCCVGHGVLLCWPPVLTEEVRSCCDARSSLWAATVQFVPWDDDKILPQQRLLFYFTWVAVVSDTPSE